MLVADTTEAFYVASAISLSTLLMCCVRFEVVLNNSKSTTDEFEGPVYEPHSRESSALFTN